MNNIVRKIIYKYILFTLLMIEILKECRICNSSQLDIVISLGEQYIASRFPSFGDFSTPKINISLCVCKCCGLLQLYETVHQTELYEHEYGYRSGINHSMRQHLKEYNDEIQAHIELNDGDTVLDIGSNDSTMLKNYSDKYIRVGIDPTGKQFAEYYENIDLIPTYFTKEAFQSKYNTKCKVISSISMFYDLPNPVQFAKDIYECLHDDGIWTCEQSYLKTMIQRNSIDTICHEHLEYYCLKQIKHIADLAGFIIIDVKFNDCNGGSFRIYMAKKTSTKYKENHELINKILEEEIEFGFERESFYDDFMKSCNDEIYKLTNFIEYINKDDKTMFVYGASTKGNTLLQYANIGGDRIKYAVERNEKKIGKMTSTGIKIIGEKEMREIQPDYLLVLPYHFKEEIVQREEAFLNAGGQIVFPFPHFEIYSLKPRVLITGCDGFIGSYIKEQFIDYTLYGISRITTQERNVQKFKMDMLHANVLEDVIRIVHPSAIIHLAGISSAEYCFHNPVEAIQNGSIVASLCDIIHRNKLRTKLFNASSSEMYKGHGEFTVNNNEDFKYHNHPYSISKIMGHSIIDFYRDTYHLPFSNGIIFTTESSRKSDMFLLNKVVKHIRRFK